jgi:diguanylate cyclase (GGDEF)-like protein/PAS domain S-box-containing protein
MEESASKKTVIQRISTLSLRSRALVCLAAVILYLLAYLAFEDSLGRSIAVLSLVPIAIFGLVLGFWGGLSGGILFPILNLSLFYFTGTASLSSLWRPEDVFGPIALLIGGGLVGKLSDMSRRLEHELAERKRAEADLEASRERYRSLFEGAPVGLYRTSTQGDILDASPALVEMLGYPDLESLRADTVTSIVLSSDDFIRERELLDGSGVVHGFEMQLRRRDGKTIWARDTFRAVRDREGQVCFFEGSLEDITERKRIEEALRESKERFQTSVETMLDGFAVLSAVRDDSGKIIDFCYEYINAAGCRSNQKSREQLIGHTLLELQSTDQEGRAIEEYARVVETGQPLAKDSYRFDAICREGGAPARAYDLRLVKMGDGIAATWRDVTERKGVEEVEHEQRILAEALRDTAAALSGALEFDEVLDRILTNVGKVLPHDAANIMLVEGNLARLARSQGYTNDWQPEDRETIRFPLDEMPTLTQMAETGRPLAIPDTHAHPGWRDTPHSHWLRSYAGAPIRVRELTVGFLNLNSATIGYYTPEKAERLQAFADQAAMAIENARFFEELQSFARQAALLNDITRVSISAPDLDNMLQRLADRLGELLVADGAYITLWDEDRQEPIPSAAYGSQRRTYPGIRLEPGEVSMTASVLKAGRVLVAEDTANSPYVSPRIAAIFPDKSLLGLPLISDGRWLGSALLGFHEYHHFTPDEIALGEQAAAQVSLAVSKAQLLESERKRTTQLARANALITALGQVATRVATAKEVESVLETLGGELNTLGLYCLVALSNPDEESLIVNYLSLSARSMALAEKLAGRRLRNARLLPEHFPFYEEIIQDRRAIFASELTAIPMPTSPGIRPALIDELSRTLGAIPGSRGFFLPLAAGEQVLGALWMWGPDLEESDLPAASLFAGQIAVALENARLYLKIQQMAITDELTGLYNRRGLFEVGRREAERAFRFGHALAAIMIDIDHFKVVNDTYNHAIGDQVLRSFAACCRRNMREIDVIGRMGGEEFVVLLPENDLDSAQKAAERLRQRIREHATPTVMGEVHITVSMGVAAVTKETHDLADLIQLADKALFVAKNNGRNQVATCS